MCVYIYIYICMCVYIYIYIYIYSRATPNVPLPQTCNFHLCLFTAFAFANLPWGFAATQNPHECSLLSTGRLQEHVRDEEGQTT